MEAAPPGPLGPPPDYEAALASSPAPPPTNPIGPRGAGSRSRLLTDFVICSPNIVIHPPPSDLEPPPDYCVAASLPSYEQAGQFLHPNTST